MKLKQINTGTVVNNYIDMDTGELKDSDVYTKTHTIVVKDREQFAFQYASIIGCLNDLSGLAVKLLVYCSLHAEYNTNRVHLGKSSLEEVARDFDTTYDSLKQRITELVKANILIRIGSGMYRVNPRYYWRGEGPKRETVWEYVLRIECPNC